MLIDSTLYVEIGQGVRVRLYVRGDLVADEPAEGYGRISANAVVLSRTGYDNMRIKAFVPRSGLKGFFGKQRGVIVNTKTSSIEEFLDEAHSEDMAH